MIRAYTESYLDDAMANLGDMLDYAVNVKGYDIDAFFDMFIACGLSDEFGGGNPKYITGMSGVELAMETLYRSTGKRISAETFFQEDKSKEYWAGWSLAYYQWYTGMSFRSIVHAGLSVGRVVSLYILHEADMTKFVEVANRIIMDETRRRPSNLQQMRKKTGMTQQQLSEASGVALRMIQLYEQRKSNINMAAITTVSRLAKVLGCPMNELMEIELNPAEA